jgi:pectinesterase
VHLIRFDHHFIRFFNMLHLLALVFSLAAAAIAAPTTLTARAGRTSPPSGCLSVGGSGTYKTVSAAVAKLSTSSTSAQCIFIYKGM